MQEFFHLLQKNLDYKIQIAKAVDDRHSGYEFIDEDEFPQLNSSIQNQTKKHPLRGCYFYLVACTGFEPVNAR